MKTSRHLLFAALCMLGTAAMAQTPRQDPAVLRYAVEQFLKVQTAGLPGQVNLTIGQVDARTNLPACPAPEPFLPNGSRLWGKTTVGGHGTSGGGLPRHGGSARPRSAGRAERFRQNQG